MQLPMKVIEYFVSKNQVNMFSMCKLPTMLQCIKLMDSALKKIEMLTETFWFIKNLSQTNKTILLCPTSPLCYPIICP